MAGRGTITLCSFGFKYGIPQANFYFDVTFLPNPARLPGRSLFDALDQDMYDYVNNSEIAKELIDKIVDLTLYVSKFDDIRIGIGCNSGRHRSVVIVKEIQKSLKTRDIECVVTHRDTI